jgi:hypothetical protein
LKAQYDTAATEITAMSQCGGVLHGITITITAVSFEAFEWGFAAAAQAADAGDQQGEG